MEGKTAKMRLVVGECIYVHVLHIHIYKGESRTDRNMEKYALSHGAFLASSWIELRFKKSWYQFSLGQTQYQHFYHC